MSKTPIVAINKKHQTTVNRFIDWDIKYSRIVDDTEDNGGRKQESAYNRAFELFHSLPKREQANLGKHFDTAGY